MAILLIKNSGHWMDKLTQQEIQAIADKDSGFLDKYNSRYQKGDVVEVREDDCQFGNKECLPDFLAIKVSGTKAENMHLMQPEIETFEAVKADQPEGKMLLRRKYNFDIEKEVSNSRFDEIEKSQKMLIDQYDAIKIVNKTNLVRTKG